MNALRKDTQLARTMIIIAVIAAVTILGVAIGEDFIVPTIITIAALTGYLANKDLGKALAHRLRHGPEPIEGSPEVFTELDELRGRVLELEERLDFAERLLAQPREAEPAARIREGGA